MTQADQNRSLYLTIVERAFVLGGHGKGVGEPMLPWKDKFNEVSRTFQLGLGAWVRRFLSVRLGFRAGRVYLVQDVYVTTLRRICRGERIDVRFLGKQTEITEVWGIRLGRA